MNKEVLLNNINKIHTTEMGLTRIKKNLNLGDIDIVSFIKNKIMSRNSNIYKNGKNWYCEVDNIIITINSYSYTIITAHKLNNIEILQKMIDKSNNIVFFGGAGVSTESGVRDFRGKNGLYNEGQKNNLNVSPEYMLSIDCLLKEPDEFFNYYRENLNCLDNKPNITHIYLKELEDKGKLKAIITQNIDGLHQKAGSKNVLEIHGTTYKNYCMRCNKEYPNDYIFKCRKVPKCSCGGTIRPDVVLYGEMLPDSFQKAIDYITKADLLIVAGTSLTVAPANYLINYFNGDNLVILNATKTPYDNNASLVINDTLGNIFSKLK